MIKVFIDGSCRENGSKNARCGVGLVARKDNKIIFSIGRPVKAITNNEAEYLALIHALKELKPYRKEQIIIYSDSNLVVNQVNGNWQIKRPELQRLKDTVKSIINSSKFIQVDLKWVPREMNKEANKIAQKITEEK